MSAPAPSDPRDILRIRSEKNKVGVPMDRSFLSDEQRAALDECIGNGWLVWIDCEKHPAFGWRDLDVFLVTPTGLKALESQP